MDTKVPRRAPINGSNARTSPDAPRASAAAFPAAPDECEDSSALELLPPHYRQELVDELQIRGNELARWLDITRKMKVVFHSDGVLTQFEGYELLREFDWEGYREKYGNIQRLDRLLEAEGDVLDLLADVEAPEELRAAVAGVVLITT